MESAIAGYHKPRTRREDAERGQTERHRVSHRERRHDGEQLAKPSANQDQAEEKDEVVVSGENVLDPQTEERPQNARRVTGDFNHRLRFISDDACHRAVWTHDRGQMSVAEREPLQEADLKGHGIGAAAVEDHAKLKAVLLGEDKVFEPARARSRPRFQLDSACDLPREKRPGALDF